MVLIYRFCFKNSHYEAFFGPFIGEEKAWGCVAYAKPHHTLNQYVMYGRLHVRDPGHTAAWDFYQKQKWQPVASDVVPDAVLTAPIFGTDGIFNMLPNPAHSGNWFVAEADDKIDDEAYCLALTKGLTARRAETRAINHQNLWLIAIALGVMVFLAYFGVIQRPTWWPF